MDGRLIGIALAALLLAGCGKGANAPVNDGCLHYSPVQTTVIGEAFVRDVTAPGKMTRTALMLKLDKPTCISPVGGSNAAFKRVDSIQEIELVPQSDFADAMRLAGHRVQAKGALATMQGDGVAAPVGMSLLIIGPEKPGQ